MREVARIVVGGWFITQQVDAGNDREYRAFFGIQFRFGVIIRHMLDAPLILRWSTCPRRVPDRSRQGKRLAGPARSQPELSLPVGRQR